MSYTLQEIIQETVDVAVKQAVQKVKLDLYPIGKPGLPLVMKTRLLL